MKACGGQPFPMGVLSGTPGPGALGPGLLPHSPFSTHLQSEVEDGEQAFAGRAGEVPPSEGVPVPGHQATETGEKALRGEWVGRRRGPESQGVEEGQRQRHPQDPQAGGPAGSVGSPLPAGPGAAPAGSYAEARHCQPGRSPVPAPPVWALAGLEAAGTARGTASSPRWGLTAPRRAAEQLHPFLFLRPHQLFAAEAGDLDGAREAECGGRALDPPLTPPRIPLGPCLLGRQVKGLSEVPRCHLSPNLRSDPWNGSPPGPPGI